MGEGPKLCVSNSQRHALSVTQNQNQTAQSKLYSVFCIILAHLSRFGKYFFCIFPQLLTRGASDAMILRKGGVAVMFKTLDAEAVHAMLPKRNAYAHKGNFGRDLLLCGSRGYTGAPALAAMGALRCGAGLVFLGVPESIYAIEAVKLTEPIVFPLPDENGMYSAQAGEEIRKRLRNADAVLIGCGCGQSDGVFSVVKEVLDSYRGCVVLDADGINVLSGHIDILRERTSPTILTPHDGEFIRLGGHITENRAESAAELAKRLGTIVLLKGHETVITDGETCYKNRTGNAGMAVGGSGDVLAGMIVGLLGQGMAPIEAAAVGAWLHGAAGDLCEKEFGQYAMLPSDMLGALSRLMK